MPAVCWSARVFLCVSSLIDADQKSPIRIAINSAGLSVRAYI
ncbi:hypothetical protein imdm_1076 [gamma proteobacterium IMCC2047]|nr:hypothetical protein imdm_1076 [gamma proteobacterium IMCC2047]